MPLALPPEVITPCHPPAVHSTAERGKGLPLAVPPKGPPVGIGLEFNVPSALLALVDSHGHWRGGKVMETLGTQRVRTCWHTHEEAAIWPGRTPQACHSDLRACHWRFGPGMKHTARHESQAPAV